MNKKFIPVLLVLTVACFFIAFSRSSSNSDNPKSRYEKILRNVGLILEEGHFSPKKIDDAFSKNVLTGFIKELDDDKTIFLQADIDSFQRFTAKIDDEIHGAKLESFYFIAESYSRRLNEASQFYTDVLSKPLDFTKDETVLMDGDKAQYVKTNAERKDLWRKRVKYLVLGRYNDMLEDREKNRNRKITPDTDSATADAIKKFVYKADTTLEREARDQVRKQLDRYFTTLKNHNSTDELFSSFVNAITAEMDPHSNYFAPVDSRSFNEMMSGKFYGIGAQLKDEESKIKVASLVTGGPAWKSGELGVNDEIIKIGQGTAEPVDVTGYAVTDAVKLIRGAQVVSMSFGKDFSPQKQWVDDAVKYAEKKGVLLVHAAGNDSKNIDTEDNFPTVNMLDGKRAANWITVGASGDPKNGGITARFSNFGKKDVDVFAPGVQIYATIPGGNTYGKMSGTSMACPVVAGTAALLLEYFPTLSATQLKYVIEKSATAPDIDVNIPGTDEKTKLSELSKTGGLLNAYEAVKLASTLKGERKTPKEVLPKTKLRKSKKG